jgi:hypothetical protein
MLQYTILQYFLCFIARRQSAYGSVSDVMWYCSNVITETAVGVDSNLSTGKVTQTQWRVKKFITLEHYQFVSLLAPSGRFACVKPEIGLKSK